MLLHWKDDSQLSRTEFGVVASIKSKFHFRTFSYKNNFILNKNVFNETIDLI